MQRVAPETKLPLRLSARERDLVLKDSLAPDELTACLRIVPPAGKPLIARYTLQDLDDLSGYVAFEANHAKNRKLEKEWRAIFAKISDIVDTHTDDE